MKKWTWILAVTFFAQILNAEGHDTNGGGKCKFLFSNTYIELQEKLAGHEEVDIDSLDKIFERVKIVPKQEPIENCANETFISACSRRSQDIIEIYCGEEADSIFYLSSRGLQQLVLHELLAWEDNIDDRNGASSARIIEGLYQKDLRRKGRSKRESLVRPEEISTRDIQGLFKTAENFVNYAEQLVEQEEYGLALLESKQIVDRVSIIRPKTQVVKVIHVDDVLEVSDLKKNYSQLSFRKQQAIAKAVGEESNGYFMDLLNLLKRGTLLYSRAYYGRLKGQLLQRDLELIENKLVEAHNTRLYIQDKNLEEPLLIFDDEIANPLQQELFNRELLHFLLSVEELELSESAIEDKLEQDRLTKRREHWDSLRSKPPAPEYHGYGSPNFEACSKYIIGGKREYTPSASTICIVFANQYTFHRNREFARCFSNNLSRGPHMHVTHRNWVMETCMKQVPSGGQK